MSISALTVRPLVSPAEYQHYYYLSAVAFGSPPYEEGAQQWQRFVTQSPEFRPEQVRGVFRDSQLLGGYTIHERVLRMGEARISTGCIGGVVTDPVARKQGVASALLQDAQTFAQENGHALLMLDGIPNFYYRFGYTDVFDATAVEIDRSAILAQAPTAYGVRAATSEDAAAILALYYRHFGASTGSFERSLEVQTYRLLHAQRPPVVALSPDGEIEGYLFHDTGDEIAQGREVAADNWEALLTLLQYHARLLPAEPATPTLLYFLPHNAPMTQWMIDTLEVPDTSQWHSAARRVGRAQPDLPPSLYWLDGQPRQLSRPDACTPARTASQVATLAGPMERRNRPAGRWRQLHAPHCRLYCATGRAVRFVNVSTGTDPTGVPARDLWLSLVRAATCGCRITR